MATSVSLQSSDVRFTRGVSGSLIGDPLSFGCEVFGEVFADDGPEDRDGDGPAAVRAPALQDAFPNRLGGVAADEVLGLIDGQAPCRADPRLERDADLRRRVEGVLGQGVGDGTGARAAMEVSGRTVEKMISLAARAGAFRAAARRFPDGRETLLAAADLNSAKAATLATEIAMAGPGKVPSDRIGG